MSIPIEGVAGKLHFLVQTPTLYARQVTSHLKVLFFCLATSEERNQKQKARLSANRKNVDKVQKDRYCGEGA